MEELAKQILGCEAVKKLPQRGNRNLGIYVSVSDHRFAGKYKAASCKFYKGDGSTPGFSKGYMPFHRDYFPKIGALRNPLVQQSLECGVWAGNRPYAVFQFIEGEMLRDIVGNKDTPPRAGGLSAESAKNILRDMFCGVWIPLWLGGIRFRDGHTGNWVLGADGRAYMIDTEQMRKDAFELVDNPSCWTRRDKHEASCLRLVSGIFADFSNACGLKTTDAAAKAAISKTNFLRSLSDLGRAEFTPQNAVAEFENALKQFF